MSKFHVYITSNDGEGSVQSLPDWDSDDSNIEIHLSAFARDAVISIEQLPSDTGDEKVK